MKDEIVSHTTALLAWEKGFHVPTTAYFAICGDKQTRLFEKGYLGTARDFNSTDFPYQLSAPTQSLLARWLRETHGIHVIIRWDYSYSIEREYHFVDSRRKDENGIQVLHPTPNSFPTYEEAMEIGLMEALKLI